VEFEGCGLRVRSSGFMDPGFKVYILDVSV
jgi:hypothetical protein